MSPRRWLPLVWLAAAAGLLLTARPERPVELACWVTPLEGRTPNQADNARRAAAAIDGAVIEPGATFSFNDTVGPWTRARGYRPAPVSFGGELVIADGGGVCQTSTTLYGAALRAGLRIVERDRHRWLPAYAPPGEDAAVAQGIADLRLRNDSAQPIVIAADGDATRLRVRLLGRRLLARRYVISRELVDLTAGSPRVLFERETAAGVVRRVRPGRPGCQVRVWREADGGAEPPVRELISDDRYPALAPVVRVGARP